MNRTVYFNSPFLLGFEHLERLLERTAKAAGDGYPPYNIEQSSEDKLRITLAVAGFGREELNVTVEDRQLVIRGKQSDAADKNFLHRGIAARQFQRAFVLAEGIRSHRRVSSRTVAHHRSGTPESRKCHQQRSRSRRWRPWKRRGPSHDRRTGMIEFTPHLRRWPHRLHQTDRQRGSASPRPDPSGHRPCRPAARSMCCMPATAACWVSPMLTTPPMARRCRTN